MKMDVLEYTSFRGKAVWRWIQTCSAIFTRDVDVTRLLQVAHLATVFASRMVWWLSHVVSQRWLLVGQSSFWQVLNGILRGKAAVMAFCVAFQKVLNNYFLENPFFKH